MHSKFSTCIKVVGGALKVFTGKGFMESTLKDNKSPIIVRVNEEEVIAASKSTDAQAYLAFIIAHETRSHALNDKTGVSTGNETEEHQKYYNDKSLRGSESTPYKEIKENSPAGRDKSRIEKAAKEQNSE